MFSEGKSIQEGRKEKVRYEKRDTVLKFSEGNPHRKEKKEEVRIKTMAGNVK